MDARVNPFDSARVENFPSIDNIFSQSPSIDTIARTKPVDFSFGERSRSSVRTAGGRESQWDSAVNSAPRSIHSNPAASRPRVAKQLNFAVPEDGVAPGSWREDGPRVSRSLAIAAGWPEPRASVGTPSLVQQAPASRPEAAEVTADAEMADVSGAVDHLRGAAPPAAAGDEASVPEDMATDAGVYATAEREVSSVAVQPAVAAAPRPSLPPAESMPRLLPTQIAAAASMQTAATAAMPRSPSAPALRARGAEAGGPPPPALPETVNEVRQALLQPPTFAFTQYLSALRSRWSQRPFRARSRLMELGLSPSKPRHPLAADPLQTPAPPSWMHAPPPPPPVTAVPPPPYAAAPWTPYPYYWAPPPPPMMAPPPYWGAPPMQPWPYYASPTPGSPTGHAAVGSPWMAPPPLFPAMQTGYPTGYPAWWPPHPPMSAGGGGFSTATLPASRAYFQKYVQ